MDVSREVQTSKSYLTARGVAFDLLQMAKRVGPQYEAAEYEHLSGEKGLTLDRVVIDDFTILCYLYLLNTKDEPLHFFKIYKAEIENQLEKRIKRVRSDHGGE